MIIRQQKGFGHLSGSKAIYGVCSSVGRAPGCGSGGHGFDSHQTPFKLQSTVAAKLFFCFTFSLKLHGKGFFSSSIARKEAFIPYYNLKCSRSFFMPFLLYKVKQGSQSILYFVQHFDGVFIVLVVLVFKENDSLLYQLVVIY